MPSLLFTTTEMLPWGVAAVSAVVTVTTMSFASAVVSGDVTVSTPESLNFTLAASSALPASVVLLAVKVTL